MHVGSETVIPRVLPAGTVRLVAITFAGYGYRRMTAQLQAKGLRIMLEAGLLCRQKRRTVRTIDSAHALPVYPNLYRGIAPMGPNRAWMADLTYVGLAGGHILRSCSTRDNRMSAASITPTAVCSTPYVPIRSDWYGEASASACHASATRTTTHGP